MEAQFGLNSKGHIDCHPIFNIDIESLLNKRSSRIVTIEEIRTDHRYTMSGIDSGWSWIDEMIEYEPEDRTEWIENRFEILDL